MIKATEIYYNGNIITMDGKKSTATHLAVKGDTILAVGHAEVLQYKNEETALLERYIELAPREDFRDILEAVEQFPYFESRRICGCRILLQYQSSSTAASQPP